MEQILFGKTIFLEKYTQNTQINTGSTGILNSNEEFNNNNIEDLNGITIFNLLQEFISNNYENSKKLLEKFKKSDIEKVIINYKNFFQNEDLKKIDDILKTFEIRKNSDVYLNNLLIILIEKKYDKEDILKEINKNYYNNIENEILLFEKEDQVELNNILKNLIEEQKMQEIVDNLKLKFYKNKI